MRLREMATIIKASLPMEQIVSVYLPGERIKRGFIACPFHGEQVGSLKVYDDSFYCFGCHAGGDAVDFVGRLLSLSPSEAVARINDDFSLGLPIGNASMQQRLDAHRRGAELIKQREAASEALRRRTQAFTDLMDKWTVLAVKMRDNAPTEPDAPYPAAWVEAAKQIDQAAWELDCAELPGGR
jgi:DNA primase